MSLYVCELLFSTAFHPQIDGEEEHEVQDILNHRRSGRGYQYLVSWTGYDASKNQWLPEREL